MTTKYSHIAAIIERQIKDGSFGGGGKLPSIRTLSKELKVSIGTIQTAYEMLEDKGIIVSKNRSGFYVQNQNDFPIDTPVEKHLASQPQEVNILETSINIMEIFGKKMEFPLGSAVPHIEARAVRQLQSSLRKSAYYTPNRYEGPQGLLALRQQIARRSIRTGKTYRADEIILTTGCQEALSIAIQIITKPGDIVIVESPCYYGLLQTLEVLKRKVVEVPLCPTNGMDINDLEMMLKKHAVKAIMLNPAFSNPTGYTYDEGRKKDICTLLKKYNVPLIEDDVFADLSKSEDRPKTIHSFDTEGNVLLCSSFSKTLSQDIRVGYLVPGRFFKQARAYKYVSTIGTPSVQQYALTHFLSTQNYERHLRYISMDYYKKQTAFLQLLKHYFPEDIKASHPAGGYLSWIKLSKKVDSMQLYRKAAAHSISITPGQIFSTAGRFKNYIRLNYGYISIERMSTALEKLSRLLPR